MEELPWQYAGISPCQSVIVEIRHCTALNEFDIFGGAPPKSLVPIPLPFPTAVFVLAGVGGVAK